MTCAHLACVHDVYMHSVCSEHLASTFAAGHRASLVPQRRMEALLAARYEEAQ